MDDLELVLNTQFGGFHFDTEMALWLIENRNWVVLSEKEYDYKKEYPINTLTEVMGDYYYSPHKDTIELRSNKDLIDCVRFLKEKHKDDVYPEKYYGHIHSLSVKRVKVRVEIEDYHDGKEKINCWIDEENAN